MPNEKKLPQQNSFDIVLTIAENTFNKIPRKDAKRKKLPGCACSFCKAYYKCYKLNENDLKLRLKKVSG